MFQFPFRPAVALLSRSSLSHNLSQIQKRLNRANGLHSQGASIMAVVKADAYGHRASIVAPELKKRGIKEFCVASLEEGIELRKVLPRSEILVLGGTLDWSQKAVRLAVENHFSLGVNDLSSFAQLSQRSDLKLHLKFDTGMNRLGVQRSGWGEAIQLIKKKKLHLDGMYTHFASFGSTASFRRQAQIFEELVRWTESEGIKPRWLHCENSAALFSKSPIPRGILSSRVNLVRPGISMYGYFPKGFSTTIKLRPILELRSELSLIKQVAIGEGISYDHLYRAKKKHEYAIVPMGYADGIAKEYSQFLEPLWYDKRGRKKGRLKICGAICMDMLMLRSESKRLERHDRVSFWGDFPNPLIKSHGVDPYELNLRIAPRIPRVWVA